MVAFTVSTHYVSPASFSLGAGDWLTVTRFGSILSGNATGAVVGAGANAIQVDGSVFNPDLGGTGPGIRLNSGNNTLVVGAAGQVQGAHGAIITGNSNTISCAGLIKGFNGSGILIDGTSNAITIESAGSVLATVTGVRAGGGTTFNNLGTVTVLGSEGARFSGNGNTITNAGSIDANGAGIIIEGNAPAGANSIVNTGVIRCNSGAIFTGDGTNAFFNTGTIETTIGTAYNSTAANTVINNGFAIAHNASVFLLGNAGDTVVNNGLIHARTNAAQLSGGNDTFDGRLGVQVGLVNGEAGNDTIYGGAQSDMLAGGTENDTLYGMAGVDALAGGDGIDTLYGGDGADNLMGEAGTDLIYGGAGGDVIRGGLGGDLIVFNVGDNGDLIQNFNEGGTRDGFDLRGYFNATGYTGTTPRAAGIMQVLQNGADTDVYLHGAFAFRIQGVAAAAIDDTYFLFQ